VGEPGQEKLKQAKVLVVGTGGLGSPAAFYLAAAGVGRLGIADSDRVDLSNLQRQILHSTSDIGRPKVESAAEKLARLNPGCDVVGHAERVGAENAARLIEEYDIVVDGTDNFKTRFILNDACVAAGKPFVHGAVLGWVGQAMTVVPGAGPCYRCVFGEAPGAGGGVPGDDSEESGRSEGVCASISPERVGVLSPVPGVIGTIQATEAIKLIVGAGEPLVGRLLIWDGLRMEFDRVEVARDPGCAACGRLTD
jgi:adenylyltransferase/sulfurtransferase